MTTVSNDSNPATTLQQRNTGGYRMGTTSRRATALVAGLLVAALAACGGSGSSDEGGPRASGEVSADLAAAKASVARYTITPTAIPQSKPLGSVPPKKTVAFIQCADPNCALLARYIKDATTALSWDLVTFSASGSDVGAAVQQAIDADVDYIGITGVPIDLYRPQMNEAKLRGIPLFQCYSTDVPEGPGNNLYADCYDSTAADAYSRALMNWVTADSAGSAKVLAVTIPTYPILEAQITAAKDELGKNCPSCDFDTLEVTVNDLAGGAVPQSIVSYLQAHPDVNYLYFTYNTLANGVHTVLEAAGVADKVKVVGTQGGQPEFAQVSDGTSAAWSALPQEFSMWTMVDQMARLSVNQWSLEDERTAAVPPFYLVSTPEQAKELVALKEGWPGPDGYKDTFKKLWGV